MNRKLPVAAHLSDIEYRLLMQVYANHNRSMGLKERGNHSLSHITKVIMNTNEKCLEVHYQNGNWWKYYSNGSWA